MTDKGTARLDFGAAALDGSVRNDVLRSAIGGRRWRVGYRKRINIYSRLWIFAMFSSYRSSDLAKYRRHCEGFHTSIRW